MEFRRFAGTRLYVSEVCLGTMTFGGQTSEEDAVKIIQYAMENGINFIDTADIYPDAGGRPGGTSEIAVGKGIKGHRQDVILATKVRYPRGRDINARGLSRRHIVQGVEESLQRLGTDYIDIYYMHLPDDLTSMDETLYALDDLVRSGKIRYAGFANFASWQIADALGICDRRNLCPPVVTQNIYNLLTRSIENELVPCVKAHKVALTIYNPLCGGLLTGKHTWSDVPTANTRFSDDPEYVDRYWNRENFEAVDKLKAIAAGAGMTIAELALRWVLTHDYITSMLVGCTRLEQMQSNIAVAGNGPLSDDIMKACDDVWNSLPVKRFYYTNQRQD